MRVTRVLSTAVLAACLVLPATTHVLAGAAEKTTTKAKKKTPGAPAPARPAGVARQADPVDAYYGGSRNDSVTESTNELGQTVYSVAASHFDISPPLSELATAAAREQATEEESPTNPQIPATRIIRSEFPDPVVQEVVEPGDSQKFSGVPLAAPTTGFNFLGVGINGGTPSDCNGAVGNNQFVETVNTRYQIWSLNRTTKIATSILLSPSNINTLWSGFGGACETLNSGDPIVLFDRTANPSPGRWLISQFTSSPSGGVYYQCVAVSTTANATGTYARYAFAVPNGKFGDYPHISVWPDAYYMMAHGFNGQFVAIFAAMDRAKMLSADPLVNAAATWVVIQDPNEGGHMPADLDGYTFPPNKAPGIFASIHSDGMYIYRMKVNFVSPGTTTNTLQAVVPVAPANAACGGGTCIPQPGTGNTLDAISDRLMFRAAYRNYVDHESLVVSHSVDPSVSGVASGVRWYDFRLSGPPDPTCPTYPCIYQQGTIADAPNGRSRWMSSLAMDSAENILVGYTATGKTAGTENHSTRYTGRAKSDPPGQMTVPETTIFTGTANNTSNTRWGDYSSMSIDPVDDCTFWSVSQYYAAQNQWSTRIASVVYPAGTGAGQCQAATCTARPSSIALNPAATTPADNQIRLTWTGATPRPGSYAIERALGTCGAEGLYSPLAATPGTATTYTDATVLAGLTYAYRVRGATDASGKCNSLFASQCVNATATGSCVSKPSFSGAASAASSGDSNCGVTINWAPGASNCLAAPNLRYNIFRGTVPDFVPSVANRIATCVVGPSSYLDTDNLQSGNTYYYVVHAEDSSSGNGGACGGGNEESNSVRISATPYAAGMQAAPGTWTDGGGDGSAQITFFMTVTTGPPAWRFVKTANDPGANHTPGGAYAYRNAGPAAGDSYPPSTCAQLYAPPLTAGATTVNLQYWERHQVEYHWDAIAVEYSVNGGAWTDVPAPSNSEAAGCALSDDTTGWEPLSCTGSSPGNACGFPDTKNVFSGPLASGTSCADFVTGATPSPYAHRCHQITGLAPDDTIRFRWQFSSDGASEYAGFYLDDVAVTNVKVPNVCAPNTCVGQANGTACADGDACTTGDVCSGNACLGGTPIAAPAETASVTVAADKTTYDWSAVASATRYDVVRGSLAALPVGPGGVDEACFDDLPGPSLVDATIPAADTGFWYLSRGENACGTGSLGQQSSGASRITTTCP